MMWWLRHFWLRLGTTVVKATQFQVLPLCPLLTHISSTHLPGFSGGRTPWASFRGTNEVGVWGVPKTRLWFSDSPELTELRRAFRVCRGRIQTKIGKGKGYRGWSPKKPGTSFQVSPPNGVNTNTLLFPIMSVITQAKCCQLGKLTWTLMSRSSTGGRTRGPAVTT